MIKYYTGVGSRETPLHILDFMRQVGNRMAQLGYIGRSGSADGADYYFELGFLDYIEQTKHNPPTEFNSFIPWNKFKTKHGIVYEDKYHICPSKLRNYQQAIQIASETHPAWGRCSDGAKALHTRNIYQILGEDLNTPSNVLFCYAEPTTKGVKGGTNTAWLLAHKYNIPCYNFYYQEHIDKIKELLKLN